LAIELGIANNTLMIASSVYSIPYRRHERKAFLPSHVKKSLDKFKKCLYTLNSR
jgi:hypothetical protein